MKRDQPKYHQIIDAAVEVIAEFGYHQAQVSKIAKRAGVADGTIYLYFKNKDDLLISLFKEKMGESVEKTRKVLAGKKTATEKLLTMIEMHFMLLAEDPKMAIVTQLEIRQSNKKLRQEINKSLKGYIDIIDELLMEGQNEGLFSLELDLRLARQMVFGTIDEVVSNWVMKEQKFDLVSKTKPIHQLLIHGLGGI